MHLVFPVTAFIIIAAGNVAADDYHKDSDRQQSQLNLKNDVSRPIALWNPPSDAEAPSFQDTARQSGRGNSAA
jgi:hypothetical protein